MNTHHRITRMPFVAGILFFSSIFTFVREKEKISVKFRILITKTLVASKNMYHEAMDTEETAKQLAQERLLALDGDVAVITSIDHG